jgi:hypothetical protein
MAKPLGLSSNSMFEADDGCWIEKQLSLLMPIVYHLVSGACDRAGRTQMQRQEKASSVRTHSCSANNIGGHRPQKANPIPPFQH